MGPQLIILQGIYVGKVTVCALYNFSFPGFIDISNKDRSVLLTETDIGGILGWNTLQDYKNLIMHKYNIWKIMYK